MKKKRQKWKPNDARYVAIKLKRNEFIGSRFGRLLVVSYDRSDGCHSYWETKCDCGNIRINTANSLRRGNVVSCGCYSSELLSKRNTRHKLSSTKIYKVWHAIIQRCYNTDCTAYKNYGARGIVVSDNWIRFETFYEEFGKNKPYDGAAIDRIDNDGPYSLENCKWSSIQQQQINKQQTVWIEYEGKQYCSAHLAKKFNIPKETFRYRLKVGWPLERALNQPKD